MQPLSSQMMLCPLCIGMGGDDKKCKACDDFGILPKPIARLYIWAIKNNQVDDVKQFLTSS